MGGIYQSLETIAPGLASQIFFRGPYRGALLFFSDHFVRLPVEFHLHSDELDRR